MRTRVMADVVMFNCARPLIVVFFWICPVCPCLALYALASSVAFIPSIRSIWRVLILCEDLRGAGRNREAGLLFHRCCCVIRQRSQNQESCVCGDTHRPPWTGRDLRNYVLPRFHWPGRYRHWEAAITEWWLNFPWCGVRWNECRAHAR